MTANAVAAVQGRPSIFTCEDNLRPNLLCTSVLSKYCDLLFGLHAAWWCALSLLLTNVLPVGG